MFKYLQLKVWFLWLIKATNSESMTRDFTRARDRTGNRAEKKKVAWHERDVSRGYLKKTFLPSGDTPPKDQQSSRDGVFSPAFPQGGAPGSSWFIIAHAKATRLFFFTCVCSFY